MTDIATAEHERWIVQLCPGQFLATWSGDPGRTCVMHAARVYRSEASARRAIAAQKGRCPHRNLSAAQPIQPPSYLPESHP